MRGPELPTRPSRRVELTATRQECARFGGQAHDLVGGLPIELEVELRFGAPILPVRERFELRAPQASFREADALHDDAHARCLPFDTRPERHGLRCADDAARDEPRTAFVLTRKNED